VQKQKPDQVTQNDADQTPQSAQNEASSSAVLYLLICDFGTVGFNGIFGEYSRILQLQRYTACTTGYNVDRSPFKEASELDR